MTLTEMQPSFPIMNGWLTSIAVTALLGGSIACGRLPRGAPPSATVWLLPSPTRQEAPESAALPAEVGEFQGTLIVLDSSTLSPVDPSARAAAPAGSSRIAMVTTYQGTRYHPESIRALTDDPAAVGALAGRIATAAAANGTGLFVDFQGATPDEINRTTMMSRAIADSGRAHGLSPIGTVVPPGDTIGYPTAVLARTSDLIIIRLHGEHRAGTAPGPLASPDWIARQIGMRASEIGVNRLVAELPLFGYRWDKNGSVNDITYAEAQKLVRSEAGVFRRDPASGSLVASSVRSGWTIWIGDARTLELLIKTARRAGVRRFVLLSPAGADPDIWTRLPAALKR